MSSIRIAAVVDTETQEAQVHLEILTGKGTAPRTLVFSTEEGRRIAASFTTAADHADAGLADLIKSNGRLQ